MIPTLRNISYEMRLKECGLTTLETRRLRGDQIEVFKILNGYESIDRNRLTHIIIIIRVVGPNLSFAIFLMFPCSLIIVTIRSIMGSCFMYLSEILSKLQMCKVTSFMKFSDSLLILLINHTH